MTAQRVVRVRVTFEIDVPFDDAWSDEGIQFDVEENSCMNTHSVGAAFAAIRKRDDDLGFCWGCNLQCKQEIIGGDWKRDGEKP